jgi:hypothetical protein
VTQTIKANAQGEFAYAVPEAGRRVFAAIGRMFAQPELHIT